MLRKGPGFDLEAPSAAILASELEGDFRDLSRLGLQSFEADNAKQGTPIHEPVCGVRMLKPSFCQRLQAPDTRHVASIVLSSPDHSRVRAAPDACCIFVEEAFGSRKRHALRRLWR
jgi:hypothetical protein